MPFCFEFGDEHGPETPHMNTPTLTCLPPNTRKTEALHIHKQRTKHLATYRNENVL
jgi:hypothetical protein